VAYSAVGQFDKTLLEQLKKEGCILGCEGSGVIEDVGPGMDGALLKGRKVAFLGDAWSEYAVKNINELIFLDEDVDLKQAAGAFVNPMSALCLRKIVKDKGCTKCIIDGASSHLAKLFI